MTLHQVLERVTGILARVLPGPIAEERARNVLQSVALGGCCLEAASCTLANTWAMKGHQVGSAEISEVTEVLQQYRAAQGGNDGA